MGQIKELSCECGYRKRLFAGVGRMGISERMARQIFTEEELADFDKAKAGNLLNGFVIENVKVYCPVCKELFALAALKYNVAGTQKVIEKSCPQCGGKTLPAEGCPKCGRALEEKEAGHWD